MKSIFVIALLCFASAVNAHGGGTDAIGCHSDGKGRYHCHKGPLAGQSFKSAAEASAALQNLTPTHIVVERKGGQAIALPAARVAPPTDARKQLSVISWNMKHLGRPNMNVPAIVKLLKEADLITLQEVNTSNSGKTALNSIAAQLQALLGEKVCKAWSATPTGGKELYAYLWKNNAISYIKTNGEIMKDCPDTALTIRLGVRNAERIVREPAYGTFFLKSANQIFVLASIHLVPEAKDPAAEIEPLFDTFTDVSFPTIIAGDYNLDSSHEAFAAARDLKFTPVFAGVNTSLKTSKRELHKPLDNFWFRNMNVLESRVINLFDRFTDEPSVIIQTLSDHCPVWAKFELE